MTTAYLTVDDGPSPSTPYHMDFLCAHGITPVLFFRGVQLERYRAQAIDAIKRGALVGSHTYHHYRLSELDYDTCLQEIDETEVLLDDIHAEAGIAREYRLIRFPYADKGGRNEPAIQQCLQGRGFVRLDDRSITHAWYRAMGWGQDIDAPYTFDLEENKLDGNDSFAYRDILDHIEERQPTQGGSLYDGTLQIILMHDLERIEAIHPGYFTDLVSRLQAAGVRFVRPRIYIP